MTDRKTKSLSYIAEPVFSEKQLIALVQQTPAKYVKTRQGRGGRQFAYTTVSYVQDRLNQIFGWGWSFQVKDHGTSPQGSIWVLGSLTILDPKTRQVVVTKEQFGSSEYKLDRSGKETDYADDLKSATSDALKKCASLLGIALDLYATEEVAGDIKERVRGVVQDIINKRKEEAQNASPSEPVPAQ